MQSLYRVVFFTLLLSVSNSSNADWSKINCSESKLHNYLSAPTTCGYFELTPSRGGLFEFSNVAGVVEDGITADIGYVRTKGSHGVIFEPWSRKDIKENLITIVPELIERPISKLLEQTRNWSEANWEKKILIISVEARLDASWEHCYGFYSAGKGMLLGAYVDNYWGIYCKIDGESFGTPDLARLVNDLKVGTNATQK